MSVRPGAVFSTEERQDAAGHRIAGDLPELLRGSIINRDIGKAGDEFLCLLIHLCILNQHGDYFIATVKSAKCDLRALCYEQTRLRLIAAGEDGFLIRIEQGKKLIGSLITGQQGHGRSSSKYKWCV